MVPTALLLVHLLVSTVRPRARHQLVVLEHPVLHRLATGAPLVPLRSETQVPPALRRSEMQVPLALRRSVTRGPLALRRLVTQVPLALLQLVTRAPLALLQLAPPQQAMLRLPSQVRIQALSQKSMVAMQPGLSQKDGNRHRHQVRLAVQPALRRPVFLYQVRVRLRQWPQAGHQACLRRRHYRFLQLHLRQRSLQLHRPRL